MMAKLTPSRLSVGYQTEQLSRSWHCRQSPFFQAMGLLLSETHGFVKDTVDEALKAAF